MPATQGESTVNLSASPVIESSPKLSRYHQPLQTSRTEAAHIEKDLELDEISTKDIICVKSASPTTFTALNEDIVSGPPHFSESYEAAEPLLSALSDPHSAADSLPMGQKSNDSNARSQNQARSTGSGVQHGQLNGPTNGAADGKMNTNIEMRRKHVSPDLTTQTENLMSRETFSLDNEPPPTPDHSSSTAFFDLPRQDRRNFLLLVLLYFLQGIPMGLAAGSVPFILKKKNLSYSQLGIFSLAIYPYSLKLLWSPIVDAVWSPRFGRRKSWILPIQLFSGFGMLYMGGRASEMIKAAGAADGSGVWTFTRWWFFLVLLCATQDIAVDGWALTLLSPSNLSYASTAQTVGLTAGSFLSHTVFLAFNSPEFANHWLRKTPGVEGVMTLGGYLIFWGWAYIVVTLGLAVMKREEKADDGDGIVKVYKSMLGILKLRNIQGIVIIHLISKIGFQANDAVTNLKLLEKGFSQEDLALTVLIDFPFEIALGYYAGQWSAAYSPLHVWCCGFIGRLAAAVLAQVVVALFPKEGVQTWYLVTVILSYMVSTFTSTVMFVAISAFHAKIADPVIGGTYMTLLATYVSFLFKSFSLLSIRKISQLLLITLFFISVSNLGGTFPRFFILKLVDLFTVATCNPPLTAPSKKLAAPLITSAFPCVLDSDRHRCVEGGGTCDISRDGYHIMNVFCVIFGIVTFWAYINPAARRLQALPLRAWRLSPGSVGQ